MILIFDKKGNYFCKAENYSIASKIVNISAGNIFRVANNGDIHRAKGYYFFDSKKSTRWTKQYILKIEVALKILMASELNGLQNRLNQILKIIYRSDVALVHKSTGQKYKKKEVIPTIPKRMLLGGTAIGNGIITENPNGITHTQLKP